MSEEHEEKVYAAIPQSQVNEAVGEAFAVGCNCEAAAAPGAVIDALGGRLGPIIQKIWALIQAGVTNLPAILAELQAAGVVLPPWVNLIIQIMLGLAAKPAA